LRVGRRPAVRISLIQFVERSLNFASSWLQPRRESGINSKTLSLTLRFLEQQRIVKREIVSTRPFNVQYSLTASGVELKPALEAFGDWGSKWLPKFKGNKTHSQHATITQKISNR
jgi:DNA-binding HxlR family transcriptional regulator